MVILAPDELVERLCEEIAYAGGKLSLVRFWDLVSDLTDNLDNKLKAFVLRCFESHPDMTITKNGKSITNSDYEALFNDCEDVLCTISEDRLYMFLTGYCKKECAVGGLAFELLMEIAKTKEHGINTMDLARKTSQDPRSITGRIKKLGNLVTGVQTIYKGHVVKHLRFHRFGGQEDQQKAYTNMRDSLQKIVEVVKNSKNGVRQLIDLKRELKFDKDKRLSKSFIAAISSLDEAGYLKKVMVISPTSPSVKIRCVKYLKDYKPEEKIINEFEDETDAEEDNEEAQSNELGIAEDEDYELLNAKNATQLLQGKNLVMEDDVKPETKHFLLNRFYPLQNQTFALVDKQGTAGLSSMQAVTMITGNDYKRSFTKCSEYYIDTVGKEKMDSNGFGLVKVYDFEGKRKFYRLFTKPYFKMLTSAEADTGEGDFRPLKPQKKDLKSLSAKSFLPLSNTLRFIGTDGGEKFFWNGELKVPANENAAPRGRKRKIAKDVEEGLLEGSKKLKAREPGGPNKQSDAISVSTEVHELAGSDVAKNTGVSVTDNDVRDRTRAVINIGGFSANSLKSLQRQRAILDAVKSCGGVTFFRDQFFEEVTKLMGSKTTLDKKTIKGDIDLLRSSNKILFRVDQMSGRRIIFLPHVSQKTISDFLVKEKDCKKSYFKDVIKNTDIFFFDSTQRDRFHSGIKSAERIKNFERKTKNGKRITTQKKADKSAEKPVEIALSPSNTLTTDRQSLVQSNMAQYAIKEEADRRSYNVGTKIGVRALVMSAVITEIIGGKIAWELITKLFPNNSLSNLEKQWTTRRIRMGHSGWKALKLKWRKLLVNALKEERATMEDVESLNLLKLINLWEEAEQMHSESDMFLLKNYEENLKKFTLIKDVPSLPHAAGPDMSSMVQRESVLLRKCYTYGNMLGTKVENSSLKKEDEIRAIVRSMLIDKTSAELDDTRPLDGFEKTDVDKTVLDMAKEKQISFLSPSKVQLSETVLELLRKKGDFEMLEKAATYSEHLLIMLKGRKGVIFKEEISNHAAMVCVNLLQAGSMSITSVPILSDEHPMHYTTRKYGFETLMPPLIMLGGKNSWEGVKAQCPIPIGKPFSRLWVNGEGSIRKTVWKQVVALVLLDVSFNPGISVGDLAARSTKLLSPSEIEQVISWCMKAGIISRIDFGGLMTNARWFSVF
ncbi:LANO_0F06942g1_1 [Lachancea nothofagi CBS 11611]|uniref:LANO_0F06942g1_1 n=1 Tax=Lachancea nothofagi CBS 11611 TaxID=1266666 RepID=A0A1G4K8R3_9SACH|nr:LANO_0F06942g1_1 [Lachancea nothofagi CBS 11611]